MLEERLAAELTVEPRQTARPEEFVAHGGLENRGDDPLQIDLAPLGSPSLALEIVDAAGVPVRLPPPPVPGGEPQRLTLATGERWPVDYAGFLPPWIPRGVYRARLHYVGLVTARGKPGRTAEVVSGWADFVLSE